MTPELRTPAVEAALLAAGRALSVDELVSLFEEEAAPPTRREVRESIEELRELWEGRALELAEVASGFRMQVRASHSRWMARLWAERAPRYTRALLETLALIAYRQPITRGQIEDVRGVSVSTSIIKTLVEREWIRVVGHREIPGRPALFGTTRAFLDHFNLKSLEELPALEEIRDIEGMVPDLFRSATVSVVGPGDGAEAVSPGDGDAVSRGQAAAGEGDGIPSAPIEALSSLGPRPVHRGEGDVVPGGESATQDSRTGDEHRGESEGRTSAR